MDADRDVFAEQLEHDRKLRRLAAFLIPDLLVLPYEEAQTAIEKARKLVQLMAGEEGPKRGVSPAAAALYSRLPITDSGDVRDALRALHIIETTLRYIEEGIVDLRCTEDIAVHIGGPVADSPHLRFGPPPANDCELVIIPAFDQASVSD